MRQTICYFLIGSLVSFSFLVFELSAQPEKHWPHYDSCQDMPEQPFVIEEDTESWEEKTEGGFCAFCDVEKFLWENPSFRQLWNFIEGTTASLKESAFKEKLQARVIGQIESKLFEIRLLKACALPLQNKNWLTEVYKGESWPKIQKSCEKAVKAVKSELKKSYPEMRLQLSLALSLIREDRILPDRATWLDSRPSHLVSGFIDLPKLTEEEKKTAGKAYVEFLSKTPLDLLDSSEFKRRLEGGGSLYLPLAGEKYLSSGDQVRLKTVERSLREQSRTRYFEIIGQNLLLGYIKSKAPNNWELVQAYSKMEQSLTKFLEEEIKASKENMSLLISYESLVEELLDEDKGKGNSSKYCLIAETARIKAEKSEDMKQDIHAKIGYLSMIPCFFSGGVAFAFCLGTAGAISFMDLKEAQKSANISLNRRLTGTQFEKISKLKEKQKDLYMAKVFFSLTFLEAGGVAKAVKSAKKKVLSKESLEKKKRVKTLETNPQLSNKLPLQPAYNSL
ncbi:MAG: hypothetical protein OXJ52_07410 [Oligoflexia bacterium]|nr:hypothetical protein [Oligoflexia bacterium]